MEGDVLVRVSHSTVNYKDGLAITGKAPVIRRWPMIPGIDFAGIVVASSHAEFKAGDAVILNGWGVGETHFGGYAQMARVKGDWLVKMPAAFTAAEAMAIGTAGYTAMLCVLALERHGVTPGERPGAGDRRRRRRRQRRHRAAGQARLPGHRLDGADGRGGLSQGPRRDGDHRSRRAGASRRPLNKERWAGAVDAVGSHTLANVLSMTKYGGSGRRLRAGAGHGPAGLGGALHPARRDAGRRRIR